MRSWTLLFYCAITLYTPLMAAQANSAVTADVDQLFSGLAQATSEIEAASLRHKIEHIWLDGDGPTLSLLMSRAQQAAAGQNYGVALTLLNQTIKLAPDWAEAWNRRAGLRSQLGDEVGALADLSRALSLEPRHFDALATQGLILKHQDKKTDALKAFLVALQLCPNWPELETQVKALKREVEGQDI
jgi:tetratricopeptide (TPR) repeat protein